MAIQIYYKFSVLNKLMFTKIIKTQIKNEMYNPKSP